MLYINVVSKSQKTCRIGMLLNELKREAKFRTGLHWIRMNVNE